jgi:hypothetical protein
MIVIIFEHCVAFIYTLLHSILQSLMQLDVPKVALKTVILSVKVYI